MREREEAASPNSIMKEGTTDLHSATNDADAAVFDDAAASDVASTSGTGINTTMYSSELGNEQAEMLQKALLLKIHLASAIQNHAANSSSATDALTQESKLNSLPNNFAISSTADDSDKVTDNSNDGVVDRADTKDCVMADISKGAGMSDDDDNGMVNHMSTINNEELEGTFCESDGTENGGSFEVQQEATQPFSCPQCDFKTVLPGLFKLHLLSHILNSKSVAAAALSQLVVNSNTLFASSQCSEPNNAVSLPLQQSSDARALVSPQQQTDGTSRELLPFNQGKETDSETDSSSKRFTVDDASPSTSLFSCSTCTFTTSNQHVYRIHLMTHRADGEQRMGTSHDCNNAGYEINGTNLGQQAVHRKKLYCPICRYCIFNNAAFDGHLASHIKDGRICCDKCPYSTESIEDIKLHVARHNIPNVSRISCPHCDFTTANKSYYKVHLATHTGEGKMYCNYCNYSTVYKSNFKQHVASHENKTELQCPLCDFKCVCKSEYGLHFAMHTGEKRLACPFCKFNTSNKSYFKQHVGSHTGAGKLTCPFCKFSTVNKSYYRIHVGKHTGEGTLQCTLCPFSTVYKNNFRRHIAKHRTDHEQTLRIAAFMTSQQLLSNPDFKHGVLELKFNRNEDNFNDERHINPVHFDDDEDILSYSLSDRVRFSNQLFSFEDKSESLPLEVTPSDSVACLSLPANLTAVNVLSAATTSSSLITYSSTQHERSLDNCRLLSQVEENDMPTQQESDFEASMELPSATELTHSIMKSLPNSLKTWSNSAKCRGDCESNVSFPVVSSNNETVELPQQHRTLCENEIQSSISETANNGISTDSSNSLSGSLDTENQSEVAKSSTLASIAMLDSSVSCQQTL
uniref:RE1-silencing transcription factor-like n=1 Tax=Hirondellea gigas TaxID=1518452 RepID=A0A6A7FYW4_9CRUS